MQSNSNDVQLQNGNVDFIDVPSSRKY